MLKIFSSENTRYFSPGRNILLKMGLIIKLLMFTNDVIPYINFLHYQETKRIFSSKVNNIMVKMLELLNFKSAYFNANLFEKNKYSKPMLTPMRNSQFQ